MEKRIELEKRGRRANQITELNLDNCRSTSIVGLTDEFTALETLSLINVGLTTLKGFPKLPNLKKLELSDNRISNGLNYLTTSPKLTHLNLSGNKIKDLETLTPLENFQNLEVLDLFNNEATSVENYREKIFAMIPSLKYLDGFDANEVEASSEGDDDEEVNGNDSEDEDKNVFWVNGLEIDLNELNVFEKSLREKKSFRFEQVKKSEPDDLDEYLAKLQIKEEESINTSSVEKKCDVCDVVESNNIVNICDRSEILPNEKETETSIPLLMYGFMAILSLVSFACFSDEMGEDEDEGEDEDDDEDESDEDENDDVSLAKIYNDDLEEDNSEWEEEIEAEEDDDDDESDEEEGADEAANQKEAETPAEEPQARGKKRKHEDV